MGWVGTILTVLAVLSGVLMTFLILLQEGKGGGLAALGGTKAAGVEGVTNPIRRATAYLAVIFFVLLIALGISNRPDSSVLKLPTTATTAPKKEETKPAEGGLKVEAPATVPAVPTTPATTPVTPEAPKAEAPKTDAPKTEASKTDAPKAETPAAPATPAVPATPAAPKAEEAKK